MRTLTDGRWATPTHLRVLRLRTMNATTVECGVAVDVRVDKASAKEEADAQKQEADCNN